MSTAEDAVEALTAAVTRVAVASSELSLARSKAGHALGVLTSEFEGTAHPAAQSALGLLGRAEAAMSDAAADLSACDSEARAYAAEAFGRSLDDRAGVEGQPLTPGTAGPVRDPATPGALGAAFRPGVQDSDGHFLPKERRIAERLAEAGASVHPRPADHTKRGLKNPDAIVRWSPEDPGTITEFKTLDSRAEASDATVQRSIKRSMQQLRNHGGGDAVIDLRRTSVTLAQARRGYVRARGEARQRGTVTPRRVLVILPSGAWSTSPPREDLTDDGVGPDLPVHPPHSS